MRRPAFAVLPAALIAVLLSIGLHPARPTRPAGQTTGPARTTSPDRGDPGHPSAGMQSQIRRFITAFLAHEVGRGNPAAEVAIRSHASPTFGRQLLTGPPTAPGRPRPGPARITSLGIDPVPGQADLLLASGEARRPDGAEPFSFLFARHGGRWLAVAPGE